LAFVAIGVWSASRKKDTPDDYLVASRNVNPWLAALSAVATNNSGFMFTGLIAAAFTSGVSASWLMIGWIGGDWLSWYIVPKRLREQSARQGATSIPGFLAGEGRDRYAVAVVAGLITLIFLAIYASAQLVASGKALAAVTDADLRIGATIGAVMVAVYCFSGGIRASIWTDVAQSVVMIFSMLGLFVLALGETESGGGLLATLDSIDPKLTSWSKSGLEFGMVGYILGWFGAGFGTVGQPHVMVRAMAVDSPEHVPKMRRIYVAWYWIFAAGCIGVGLAGRALLDPATAPADAAIAITSLADYDAEFSLLHTAQQLELPGVLIGLFLAGLFAATISTADSQVLSCSAAITQDIAPGAGKSYVVVKATTLGVTAFALAVAVIFGPNPDSGVFKLVTFAWATLASGLGPLMVIRTMRWPVSSTLALLTMLSGVAVSVVWNLGLDLSDHLYEALPGMLTGFAVYFVLRNIFPERTTEPV
jgi:sodium/proline symporter